MKTLTRLLASVLASTAMLVGALALPAVADPGEISGVAFEDLDRDAVKQPDEVSVGGVTVYLMDATGKIIDAASTDSHGWYTFGGLGDGHYTVVVSDTFWAPLRNDWVPTTTGSLHPRVDLTLSGSARADFGIRPIVRSVDPSRPLSVSTPPSGLRIESFNDAVSAADVGDRLALGELLGDEQAHTTVRFDLGGSSYCNTSAGSKDGTYVTFKATCYVGYLSWLESDATLFHEYGHAWSLYHAYLVQQDPGLAAYLEFRALADHPKLGSSHNWMPEELIAEDYRQLFGSPTARLHPQDNNEIPAAADVPGLRGFLGDTFTTQDGGATTETVDAAPVVAITDPADGATLSGTVSLVIAVTDEGDEGSADVALSVDGSAWMPATFDPARGLYVAQLDTTTLTNGEHVVQARARDAGGNEGMSPPVSVTVENLKVRGKSGGGSGGGKKK